MKLIVPPGVYRPRSDTRLLVDGLRRVTRDRGEDRPLSVLELCTGSGAVALEAARLGCEVTAVDISRRAVVTARLNARLGRLRVDVRAGDLFAPVAGRRFDLVVANPPYLPAPPGHCVRAWDAGPDGRALLDRICAGAGRHVRPGGGVLLVQSSLADDQATLERLSSAGMTVELLADRDGPLGPLAAARKDYLRSRGLVNGGVPRERLVLLWATRAARSTDGAMSSHPGRSADRADSASESAA